MAGLIKRGQIWTANLNPGFGVEIHKVRPVLVVSENVLNQSWRTIIVVPLSSKIDPLGPEKVLIPRKSSGLERDSAVLAHFVRAIDKNRLVKKIGAIKKDQFLEIEEALKLVLGMIEI